MECLRRQVLLVVQARLVVRLKLWLFLQLVLAFFLLEQCLFPLSQAALVVASSRAARVRSSRRRTSVEYFEEVFTALAGYLVAVKRAL